MEYKRKQILREKNFKQSQSVIDIDDTSYYDIRPIR